MYLIDTNFLGHLDHIYPEDVFPTLWARLVPLLFADGIFFHERVDEELRKWKNPRLGWYEEHLLPAQLLRTVEKEIDCLKEVTRWVAQEREPRYRPSAVDTFLEAADSWLVACAYLHGATIVTNEKSEAQGKKRVKIPDVAEKFNVPCLETLTFLRVLKVAV